MGVTLFIALLFGWMCSTSSPFLLSPVCEPCHRHLFRALRSDSFGPQHHLSLLNPKLVVRFKYSKLIHKPVIGEPVARSSRSSSHSSVPNCSLHHIEVKPRSPVVAVVGHVDHGKTSLLDRIRSSDVTKSEAGGITQSVRAFSFSIRPNMTITFVDTPGHAAFRDMRNRGAQMTDIVLLVVAADDGVMNQTLECIAFAKELHLPIVVAVNKMDKPNIDVDRVKEGLLKAGLAIEEFGGDAQVSLVSAKTGEGVSGLLDQLMLQAEVLDLKGSMEDALQAVVIDASLQKGVGTVIRTIVRRGALHVGDHLVAGTSWGRVKRLVADSGIDNLRSAGPSSAIQIVGLEGMPASGEMLVRVSSEKAAKDLAALHTKLASNEAGQKFKLTSEVSMFSERMMLKLPFILKANSAATVDAIGSCLRGADGDHSPIKVVPDLVHSGVGDVSTSDVLTASATKAKVIAFDVQCSSTVRDLAKSNNVEIVAFTVLYDFLDYVKQQVEVCSHASQQPAQGIATVKRIFTLPSGQKAVGCALSEGVFISNGEVSVCRGGGVDAASKILSLKVFKKDVEEVREGEFGVILEVNLDIKEGDRLECR